MRSRLRVWRLWSKKSDAALWFKVAVLIGLCRSATFEVFRKRYYL